MLGNKKYDQLRILIVSGVNLPAEIEGVCDTYVVMMVGEDVWRTSTKKRTSNPVWEVEYTLLDHVSGQKVRFEVWKKDITEDVMIAFHSIAFVGLESGIKERLNLELIVKERNKWIPSRQSSAGVSELVVAVTANYTALGFSDGPKLLLSTEEMHSCMQAYIKYMENTSKMDPKMQLRQLLNELSADPVILGQVESSSIAMAKDSGTLGFDDIVRVMNDVKKVVANTPDTSEDDAHKAWEALGGLNGGRISLKALQNLGLTEFGLNMNGVIETAVTPRDGISFKEFGTLFLDADRGFRSWVNMKKGLKNNTALRAFGIKQVPAMLTMVEDVQRINTILSPRRNSARARIQSISLNHPNMTLTKRKSSIFATVQNNNITGVPSLTLPKADLNSTSSSFPTLPAKSKTPPKPPLPPPPPYIPTKSPFVSKKPTNTKQQLADSIPMADATSPTSNTTSLPNVNLFPWVRSRASTPNPSTNSL